MSSSVSCVQVVKAVEGVGRDSHDQPEKFSVREYRTLKT